jgi:hypothetical protein
MAERPNDRRVPKIAWVAAITHNLLLPGLLLVVCAAARIWVGVAVIGTLVVVMALIAARTVYRMRHGITPRPMEERWWWRHPWWFSLIVAVAVVAVGEIAVLVAMRPGPHRDDAMAASLGGGIPGLFLYARVGIGAAKFGHRLAHETLGHERRVTSGSSKRRTSGRSLNG